MPSSEQNPEVSDPSLPQVNCRDDDPSTSLRTEMQLTK